MTANSSSANTRAFQARAPRHQPIWHDRAACRGVKDAEIFFDTGSTSGRVGEKDQYNRRKAKEYCAVCPVITYCRDLYIGEEFGVFGGMDRDERRNYRRMLAEGERMLTPAELYAELIALRSNGMKWHEIAARYNVTRYTLRAFMLSQQGHQEALSEPESTVDTVLTPAELGAPRNGDSWICQRGRYFAAWYLGQSTDSPPWFFMNIDYGAAQTRKWVPGSAVTRVRDVEPVYIIHRKGAPTSATRSENEVGERQRSAAAAAS